MKSTNTCYYLITPKSETVRGMVKLTFLNFSHSLHCKISIIQSFPIQYTLSPSRLKKGTLFSKLGYAYELHQSTEKVVFHSVGEV